MTEPPVERRALRLEIVLVLAVTYGLSAVTAILQLADSVLRDLSAQKIALNPAGPTSTSSTSVSTPPGRSS